MSISWSSKAISLPLKIYNVIHKILPYIHNSLDIFLIQKSIGYYVFSISYRVTFDLLPAENTSATSKCIPMK